jgi:hypothetical protein
MGAMGFESTALCSTALCFRISILLQSYIGLSIKEIGDIDLPKSTAPAPELSNPWVRVRVARSSLGELPCPYKFLSSWSSVDTLTGFHSHKKFQAKLPSALRTFNYRALT